MLMEDLGIGVAYWTPRVLQGLLPYETEDRGSWRVGLCSPSPPSSRNFWQEKELSHRCYYSISQGY